MRVCFILEGCYPYIRGGVSAWAHAYILSNPDIEFVLWTIYAARKHTGTPVYELPPNVVETHEVYLEDAALPQRRRVRGKTDCTAYIDSMKTFLDSGSHDWDSVFAAAAGHTLSPDATVSSRDFLHFAEELSDQSEGRIGLSDAYYGLKSMFLPLFYLLSQPVPQADLYHSAVAGYGGILGAVARYQTGKPFVLTEHGIYPREREEELMQADWFAASMRRYWIISFYNFSRCAYHFADRVTALFAEASKKQAEIGCDVQKCRVVGNGIHTERFINIPARQDTNEVNIGAFVRFAPIKDVKTLIYAFYDLQKKINHVQLYILGGTDDEAYRRECMDLIRRLKLDNVHVEGHVDTAAYLERVDFTVMTSISEGQPLAILESFAAARPCVCTNVGNCAALIDEDNMPGGICCHPMDIQAISAAMERLCLDPALRRKMGENGKTRVLADFTHELMKQRYLDVYKEVM